MASGKHHAYIFEIEGKFMVRPSVATIKKNEQLSIRNLTSYTASVENCTLLSGLPTDIAPRSVGTFTLTATSGIDQYEVWLDVSQGAKIRVHGESDPVIIIDP